MNFKKVTSRDFQSQPYKKLEKPPDLFGEGRNPIQPKSLLHNLHLQCEKWSLHFHYLLHQLSLLSPREILAIVINFKKNRVNHNFFLKLYLSKND